MVVLLKFKFISIHLLLNANFFNLATCVGLWFFFWLRYHLFIPYPLNWVIIIHLNIEVVEQELIFSGLNRRCNHATWQLYIICVLHYLLARLIYVLSSIMLLLFLIKFINLLMPFIIYYIWTNRLFSIYILLSLCLLILLFR